jgi:parvulin-like peptidyl-prolyl isomerase
MTFRAKPVVKGPGRSGWNSEDRRTTLLNVGFLVAIVLAIIILVGYAGWSFYDTHWGAAATVDGTTITKDQLRTRFKIENFRIDYTESRIRNLLTAGRINQATHDSQIQFLEQRRDALASITLERLVDILVQTKLAGEEGVTITDADIDAQLLNEATTDEERHSFVVEVEPKANEATGEVGDAEKAAAKKIADQALADLKAGKSWDDIAKTVSTGDTAQQNGDLGWLPKDSGLDKPFMEAIFGASADSPTDVITGDDGIYRIGRITEIAPATVDQTFESRLEDRDIKLADYREAVRGDVVRTKLSDKIVADLSKPSLQRHVLQIKITIGEPMADGVKVRHILYSPNDDPSKAKDADEAAWKKAEEEANAAYEALKQDPSKFDQMARTQSDEGSAVSTGGKQPYYDALSAVDPAFRDAIIKPGLKPGDILPPVKSTFGWHVIQFLRPYGTGEEDWLKSVREQALGGADFEQLARDQGDGAEAKDGGDIGWVARGQLGEAEETEIFKTAINGISDVIKVDDTTLYLFKVLAEETREPTPAQKAVFESQGFSDWYTKKKQELTDAGKITRNGSAASVNE